MRLTLREGSRRGRLNTHTTAHLFSAKNLRALSGIPPQLSKHTTSFNQDDQLIQLMVGLHLDLESQKRREATSKQETLESSEWDAAYLMREAWPLTHSPTHLLPRPRSLEQQPRAPMSPIFREPKRLKQTESESFEEGEEEEAEEDSSVILYPYLRRVNPTEVKLDRCVTIQSLQIEIVDGSTTETRESQDSSGKSFIVVDTMEPLPHLHSPWDEGGSCEGRVEQSRFIEEDLVVDEQGSQKSKDSQDSHSKISMWHKIPRLARSRSFSRKNSKYIATRIPSAAF